MEQKIKISIDGGGLIAGALGVLFVGLKLTKHIDWDWLWVLSPFWIPIAILTVLLLFSLIAWLLAKAYTRWDN